MNFREFNNRADTLPTIATEPGHCWVAFIRVRNFEDLFSCQWVNKLPTVETMARRSLRKCWGGGGGIIFQYTFVIYIFGNSETDRDFASAERR